MQSIGEKVDAPKGAFFIGSREETCDFSRGLFTVRGMEKRWSERKSEVEEIFLNFSLFRSTARKSRSKSCKILQSVCAFVACRSPRRL